MKKIIYISVFVLIFCICFVPFVNADELISEFTTGSGLYSMLSNTNVIGLVFILPFDYNVSSISVELCRVGTPNFNLKCVADLLGTAHDTSNFVYAYADSDTWLGKSNDVLNVSTISVSPNTEWYNWTFTEPFTVRSNQSLMVVLYPSNIVLMSGSHYIKAVYDFLAVNNHQIWMFNLMYAHQLTLQRNFYNYKLYGENVTISYDTGDDESTTDYTGIGVLSFTVCLFGMITVMVIIKRK